MQQILILCSLFLNANFLLAQTSSEPSPTAMMEASEVVPAINEMTDAVFVESSNETDISVTAVVITDRNEQQKQSTSTSYVNEYLTANIRSNIFTTEKANVAVEQSVKAEQAVKNFKKRQQAEKRKKREQKIQPNILDSATEDYLSPGSFLVQDALSRAQLEAAALRLKDLTWVPRNKNPSSAERDVEDCTNIAERKKTLAREASLTAKVVKTKAALDKADINKEDSTYTSAEEAWTITVVAYQDALKKAAKTAIDTQDLMTALNEATAHTIYWESAKLEVNAKKSERLFPAIDHMSIDQTKELESSWNAACQGYQEAITKAQEAALVDEAEEWAHYLANAVTRKTSWTTKVNELQLKTTEAASIEREAMDQVKQSEEMPSPNNLNTTELLLMAEEAMAYINTLQEHTCSKVCWQNAYEYFSKAVNMLERATEAQSNNRPKIVADAFKNVSDLYKQSALYYSNAARAHTAHEDCAYNLSTTASNYYNAAIVLEEKINKQLSLGKINTTALQKAIQKALNTSHSHQISNDTNNWNEANAQNLPTSRGSPSPQESLASLIVQARTAMNSADVVYNKFIQRGTSGSELHRDALSKMEQATAAYKEVIEAANIGLSKETSIPTRTWWQNNLNAVIAQQGKCTQKLRRLKQI